MTLTLGAVLVLAIYRVLCVFQWHQLGGRQLVTVDPVDGSTTLEHAWGDGTLHDTCATYATYATCHTCHSFTKRRNLPHRQRAA